MTRHIMLLCWTILASFGLQGPSAFIMKPLECQRLRQLGRPVLSTRTTLTALVSSILTLTNILSKLTNTFKH